MDGETNNNTSLEPEGFVASMDVYPEYEKDAALADELEKELEEKYPADNPESLRRRCESDEYRRLKEIGNEKTRHLAEVKKWVVAARKKGFKVFHILTRDGRKIQLRLFESTDGSLCRFGYKRRRYGHYITAEEFLNWMKISVSPLSETGADGITPEKLRANAQTVFNRLCASGLWPALRDQCACIICSPDDELRRLISHSYSDDWAEIGWWPEKPDGTPDPMPEEIFRSMCRNRPVVRIPFSNERFEKEIFAKAIKNGRDYRSEQWNSGKKQVFTHMVYTDFSDPLNPKAGWSKKYYGTEIGRSFISLDGQYALTGGRA